MNTARRSRHAARNYVTSTLCAGVTLLVGLFTTPCLLEWLGDETWGSYRILLNLLFHLGAVELGLAASLMPVMAGAVGETDQDVERAVVAMGIRRYWRVALWTLLAGAIVTVALPVLVPVPAAALPSLQLAFLIMLSTAILAPTAAIRIYCEASQRTDIVTLVFTCQGVVTAVLGLWLARVGWGITGQAMAYLMAMMASAVFWLLWLERKQPRLALRFWRTAGDQTQNRRVSRYHRPSLVLSLCGRLSLTVDALLVGIFLGPAAVAMFAVTSRLFEVAQSQLQNVSSASWAGFANLYAAGQHQEFNFRLIEVTRLVLILSGVFLVPLVGYSETFVQLWVGSHQFAGQWFVLICAVNVALLALFTTWSMLLRGIGRIECLVPVYVTQTAINVALSVVLVRWLGLLGPVLGTAVGFCSVTVWWLPQVLKRELRLSRNSLAYAVAGPSVLMSASVVIVRLVATKYPPANWLAWFGSTATFSLVFLLAAWWLCLATHERRLWGLRVQTWRGAKRSVIA